MNRPDLIAEAEHWTYLGDGLYARLLHGQLALATHDSYTTTNVVYLDYTTFISLARFLAPRVNASFREDLINQLTGAT